FNLRRCSLRLFLTYLLGLIRTCRSAFARIIGLVPTRSLELEAGPRDLLLELPAAFRASLGWCVSNFLNHLGLRTTLHADILVNRHNPKDPFDRIKSLRC